MFARTKNARYATLQANLHLPAQNKTPLCVARAMELAAKAHRAGAQLVTATGKYPGQHGLRRALVQSNSFLAEAGATIGIGEQDNLGEMGHK